MYFICVTYNHGRIQNGICNYCKSRDAISKAVLFSKSSKINIIIIKMQVVVFEMRNTTLDPSGTSTPCFGEMSVRAERGIVRKPLDSMRQGMQAALVFQQT